MIRYANLVGVVVLLMGCCFLSTSVVKAKEVPAAEKPSYDWRQTDSSLALLNRAKVVWQLKFDRKEGKPYFHPVGLTNGTELTCFRPADHRWHRALWFSWKYINGLNYWEEDPKTGLSPGRTEIVSVRVSRHADYSAYIEMTLRYHPPGERAELMEKRIISISSPDEAGRYYVDWASIFSAVSKDVVLGRTPIPGEEGGKSWGGYAGLSVRMAKATRGWQFVDSEGRKDNQAHGKKARWVDFSGELAGGKVAGIAIFDHPENLRHPSPWYVEKGMPYFSPAVLFNKPYTLGAKKSLMLRYRILIHPGRVNKQMLENEWKEFGSLADATVAAKMGTAEESKAAIRVDLLVCEVYADVKMDRETAAEIKKLVGEEKSLSPVAVLKKAVRGKQVAKDKLENLVDLLSSKGYLKILMNPTLEVLDGKTAKVRSSSREPTGKEIIDSFEVTPRILDDGNIDVATKMVFENKQMSDLRTHIKDSGSLVIGCVTKTEKRDVVRGLPVLKDIPLIGRLFSHRDFEERTKEILAVVTASISEGD